MTAEFDANADGVDFALVAYREDGVWQLVELSPDSVGDLANFTSELRRWPGDAGALGLVSVDEDFFLLVRVLGSDIRILLSDVTAATDWPIAREAVDALELPHPDDDDEQTPGGDVAIIADLGMGPMDMGALLDDVELYPDEMLGDIASRLGFGSLFDDAVGVAAS